MKKEHLDTYTIEGRRTGRTILRGEQLLSDEYLLVVQVWIRNSEGEYLIQQRSHKLAHLPSVWATTAGHVSSGETALEGVIRELDEELGIQVIGTDLVYVDTEFHSNRISHYWLTEIEISIDQLTLQVDEVDSVMWASQSLIESMIADGSFFDYGDVYMAKVFGK